MPSMPLLLFTADLNREKEESISYVFEQQCGLRILMLEIKRATGHTEHVRIKSLLWSYHISDGPVYTMIPLKRSFQKP